MPVVFTLDHVYDILPGMEEQKSVGIYSARQHAEAALRHVRGQPGFRDHPDHFCITEVQLDQDLWPDGFVDAAGLETSPDSTLVRNRVSE